MKYLSWVAFLWLFPGSALAQKETLAPRAVQPAPRHSGEERIVFDADQVQLLGWLPITEFPGSSTSVSDCWGYTSPSGREYALLGLSGGTGFVEVTDPGAPRIVAFQPGPSSFWRGLKTYADHAYAVSEGGGGIQVFDLGSIDDGVVTFVQSVTVGGATNTHTVEVDVVSGFLYRAGTGSGLLIYSLADPASPEFVGAWNVGQYVHECQVVTWDLPGAYLGKQIAFCYVPTVDSLRILDVTDKGAITAIGSLSYPGASYTHQGWTSEDKQYVYLNDEQDETSFGPSRTRIIDISDLAAPSYVGDFASGSASTDHNLYVKGDRIYEANYSAGLQIFDASDPEAPVLVGHFDTGAGNEVFGFTSLWSNYPFLPSGTLLGGDVEKGLFVWREGAAELQFAFPGGEPELVDPFDAAIEFTVTEDLPGNLVPSSVRIHTSTGGAFVSRRAWPVSGDLYRAEIPGLPCGREVDFYVSARSVSGITWTHPPAAPTQAFRILPAYDETVGTTDDMEVDLGWSVNLAADLAGLGSVASTGTWVRVDPIGTGAQPEDDRTLDPGSRCWVTGQGSPGGALGEADVDGGTSSLRSPLLDASALVDPHLSYWRWYSNATGVAAGTDTMSVHVSSDGGSTWVLAKTIGPTGPDTLGGWIRDDIRLADFVVPSSTLRVRFLVSDLGSGSIVEAAIDDLRLVEYDCAPGMVALTSVEPAEGPYGGGNWVTITGGGFDAGTTVAFGGSPALEVVFVSDTTLEVRVPPCTGTVSGKLGRPSMRVDLQVSDPGFDTLPKAYRYVPPQRDL
jgi:choice-of-anchor B domain-containing protein